MANPEGRVLIDEAEAQQAAKRYAQMEAELQALQQQNEEIMHELQEASECSCDGTRTCKLTLQGSDARICDSNRGAPGSKARPASGVPRDALWYQG